jgi:hypothetical protein
MSYLTPDQMWYVDAPLPDEELAICTELSEKQDEEFSRLYMGWKDALFRPGMTDMERRYMQMELTHREMRHERQRLAVFAERLGFGGTGRWVLDPPVTDTQTWRDFVAMRRCMRCAHWHAHLSTRPFCRLCHKKLSRGDAKSAPQGQ